MIRIRRENFYFASYGFYNDNLWNKKGPGNHPGPYERLFMLNDSKD